MKFSRTEKNDSIKLKIKAKDEIRCPKQRNAEHFFLLLPQ